MSIISPSEAAASSIVSTMLARRLVRISTTGQDTMMERRGACLRRGNATPQEPSQLRPYSLYLRDSAFVRLPGIRRDTAAFRARPVPGHVPRGPRNVHEFNAQCCPPSTPCSYSLSSSPQMCDVG